MPLANKRMKTVARLAMGTALISVVSGCDTRFGRAFDSVVSPTKVAVVPGPVTTATAPTVAPATQSYIPAGAPTYTEPSRAANVQTFESVYGAPVSVGDVNRTVSVGAYDIPSYNDQSVTIAPLPAPELTYIDPLQAPAPVQSAPLQTYGVAAISNENLTYGDTLTSTSYTVAPDPIPSVAASTTVIDSIDAAPAYISEAPVVASTFTTESTIVEPVYNSAPVVAEYGAAFLDDAAVQAPQPAYSASAIEPIATQPLVTEPLVTETSSSIDTSSSYQVTTLPSASEPLPAPAAVVETTPSVLSVEGFETISNEEALAVFNNEALPATVGGQFEVLPATSGDVPAPAATQSTGDAAQEIWDSLDVSSTISAPVINEVPLAPMPKTYTTVAGAEIKTTPLPRRKVVAQAPMPIVVAALSPKSAPLPNKRPVRTARSIQASLNTPLPQPRPDFNKPMAVATTVGKYISVGELPELPGAENGSALTMPKIVDEAMVPAAATDVAPKLTMPKTEKSVQVAAIQPPKAVAPKTEKITPVRATKDSELSGTSWRLARIGGAEVTGEAELHFDGNSGFAGGQGPCNSYGGEFMNKGEGMFTMANIFTTEIACPALSTEAKYIEALESATRYDITDGFSGLVIRDASGKELATFSAF